MQFLHANKVRRCGLCLQFNSPLRIMNDEEKNTPMCLVSTGFRNTVTRLIILVLQHLNGQGLTIQNLAQKCVSLAHSYLHCDETANPISS